MTFWSGEKLAERLPDLIAPFDEASIDCASYRLRVGSESYVTPPGGENCINSNTKQQLAPRAPILIPPGQFGFLVTEEEVRIPTDTLGFISIRAKLKSRGLVNVSGFHVDPGYNGRIIFAVFNAGPAPIHLARGDDCFLIWFADLDRPSEYVKKGSGFVDIPSELINPIAGEVQSFAGLLEKINTNRKDFEVRLSKIERDHSIVRWGVALLVGALMAWLGRELLPSHVSSGISTPATTAATPAPKAQGAP